MMLTELELKQVIELLGEMRTPLLRLTGLFKKMEYDRRYKHGKDKD